MTLYRYQEGDTVNKIHKSAWVWSEIVNDEDNKRKRATRALFCYFLSLSFPNHDANVGNASLSLSDIVGVLVG